ncbi:MAG: class I SAM-dependent methyltransferase [Pseudomonadota bacterium]
MDPVKRQYETYPYPARNPADEATRLIEGSPSHPLEIDHFLFGGTRDWRQPFRALVAGGGTGDGLIMLAQKLADIGCPAEITYLDLSEASRAVAEARAAARGLSGIRFLTGDLLSAPDHGPFDYIDCCGVLHHLPDPDAGFRALAAALAPEGGIGLMVYAPHGRAGVYPLQEAFGTLLKEDTPEEQVTLARAALARLSPAHPFVRNPLLGDHKDGDAGLYDLLLHSHDRPYSVEDLAGALGSAGLAIVSFVEQGCYDPARYLPREEAFRDRLARLDPLAQAALAEKLAGNMKTHVVYAAAKDRAGGLMANGRQPGQVPHLRGVSPTGLAKQIKAKGHVPVTLKSLEFRVSLPRDAAPLIAQVDGRNTLQRIAAGAGLDWIAFLQIWGAVHRELTGFNLLNYSQGARL